MRRSVPVFLAGVLACAAGAPLHAQHDMAAMGDESKPVTFHWGAHSVGHLTRVSPAVAGRTLSEAYLTQPALMGGVSTRNNRFSVLTTISLEGLTLDRGELGPGTYGEGYIDRRHPHTYLHELMGVARVALPLGVNASVALGRGFAPFGTDDPMMRPFVRFPVNHHLSQVLERLVVIGGVQRGPVTVEVGTFSGNEPLSPKDLGDPDRFADSWAARLTVRPAARWEIQASRADVRSPEEPTGQGDDQRKVSISARHDGMVGGNHVYGFAEWSRTTIVNPNRNQDVYATASMLAEASVMRSGWTGAVRLENTERPEEGRVGSFRSPWPPSDHFIIGFTRWQVVSVRAQRDVSWKGVRLGPYIETSLAHVSTRDGFFDPEEFYGATNLKSVSAGIRLDLGMKHTRMGRYGVALPATTMTHEMN
ncbi:MAG: hypothetical protein ABIV28_08385 [Longimicrobiales bacterium]